MNNSKQFLKEYNIIPTISFKTSPKHKVILLKDEMAELTNEKGEIVKGIRYFVRENEEEKTIFTSSNSLIQQLADISENTEIIIELKSRKTPDGWRSYYVVSKVGETEEEPEIIDEQF